jgi:ATP-dependent exoDNAse (exonuclease V) beta subunit
LLISPQLGPLIRRKTADGDVSAVYRLGESAENERNVDEGRRLLYVALTRARDLVLISGNIGGLSDGGRPKSVDGWLGVLSAVTGLSETDFPGFQADGEALHPIRLPVGKSSMAVTLYEEGFRPALPAPSVVQRQEMAASDFPLLSPVLPADGREHAGATEDDEDTRPSWRWQERQMPERQIGRLLHEALAQWRFADDDLENWLRARARELGLVDADRQRQAIERVITLLGRLHAHRLFRELDSAKRFHEVPFHAIVNGRADHGLIDLLLQQNGRWTVIDFKSDALPHAVPSQRIEGYRKQLLRYGAAVEQLLGRRPRLLLCLLDVEGQLETLDLSS